MTVPLGVELRCSVNRGPFWVISGLNALGLGCLLYPRKQTFVSAARTSAKCQYRTSLNLVRIAKRQIGWRMWVDPISACSHLFS